MYNFNLHLQKPIGIKLPLEIPHHFLASLARDGRHSMRFYDFIESTFHVTIIIVIIFHCILFFMILYYVTIIHTHYQF